MPARADRPAAKEFRTIMHRPPPDRLATVTVGFFASYAHYDFPQTNGWVQRIVAEIEEKHPGISMGDLDTRLGLSGYVQVLIWRGVGLRLGVQHTKGETTTQEPGSGGFGPVRAEVVAETSPVVVSYSLVKEFWLERFWFVLGAGVDQQRWSMDWKFSQPGEDPLEDWEWEGRGTGAHGFLEAGAHFGGLQFLGGMVYRRGVVEMEARKATSTFLVEKPRSYEEDIDNVHFYGGLVVSVF